MEPEIQETHYFTGVCRTPLQPDEKYSQVCLWRSGAFKERSNAVAALHVHKGEAGHAWLEPLEEMA